jgi:hypothetical protein
MSDFPQASPWLAPAAAAPSAQSFPLHVRDASFSTALGLVMQTLPYALARFAVLLGASIITLVWFVITFGVGAWLSDHVAHIFGAAWILLGVCGFGFAWWSVVRYALHLISCGHVAVLTDLITRGQVGNGAESMFTYGRTIVVQRIGQESLLYGLNMTVRGIINSLHNTLDWIAGSMPIPGLESLANVATMIMRAATRYLDKVIFSYSLARADRDAWTAAREGLIYYAQNAKPILKTSVWVVVLERVLTVLLWLVLLAPAAAFVVILPHSMRESGALVTLVIAAMLAGSLRGAFMKPVFLTMIMIRFHTLIENQAVDPQWDAQLSGLSAQFAGMGAQFAGQMGNRMGAGAAGRGF